MFFEMTIEVTQVLEAALVADFRDAEVAFHQQPAGMTDPYFGDIVGECLSGMMLEITGERGNAHIELLRDLLDINLVLIILEDELKNGVDLVGIVAVIGSKGTGQHGRQILARRQEDEDVQEL